MSELDDHHPYLPQQQQQQYPLHPSHYPINDYRMDSLSPYSPSQNTSQYATPQPPMQKPPPSHMTLQSAQPFSALPVRGGAPQQTSMAKDSFPQSAPVVVQPQPRSPIVSNSSNKQQQEKLTASAATHHTYDKGIQHDEDNIYETIIAVQWGGSLGDILKQRFTLDKHDLESRFKIQFKNMDKTLMDDISLEESSSKPSERGLKNIFIGRVQIWRGDVEGFTGFPLGLVASDSISDWNHICRPNSNVERAMIRLSTTQKIAPTDEEFVFDKMEVIKSAMFKKFGHVSSTDFHDDIEYPTVHEERDLLKVSVGSVLNELIHKNSGYLKSKFGWDGQIIKVGSYYKYPMPVVADTMASYHKRIDPMRNLCGIYDISSGMSFSLVPWNYSKDNKSALTLYESKDEVERIRGVVNVELKITYTFPRSESGRYASEKESEDDPRYRFYVHLQKSMTNYASSSTSNTSTSNSSNKKQ